MHSRFVLKSALLSLTVLAVLASPAFAVDLLGNWVYRQQGGDGLDTQSEFQQRYQLGVGPAVTYKLTPAITASGGVGYRNTQRDTGDGIQGVEQVSPFGSISLVNDIFFASASANSFTTMSGTDNSSAYWDVTLSSAWDIPFWPTVKFNYGEDFSGIDKKALFDDSNGKNQNTTVSVDWDLLLANLYYEYSINEALDGDGDSLSKDTTHYGRFQTDGRFWQDRIGVNLTQQYRESTTEFGESGVGEGPDGLFNIPVEGDVAYYHYPRESIDLPPDPADPVDNPLNLAPKLELTDGILNFIDTNSVRPVRPRDTGYFGFEPFDLQPINRLYLYLESSVDPAVVAGLTWQVYTKLPTDTSWTLESVNVPFIYNNSLARFELIFATIDGPEFLLVVNNPANGVELVFTELEAFRLASTGDSTGPPTFKSTFYQTNIGAYFRPFQFLSTSFSFNYDHSDDKNNGDKISEVDRINWGGRMSTTLLPYITPSISYSESRFERTGRPDDLTRAYSASVSTRPLPTLIFSLGYTRNDRYADNDKTNTSDTYSLFAKAAIYPDLSVSLNNSYSISDDLRADPESDEDVFIENKTFSSRLDITARLHRYVTAYGSANYSKRDNEQTDKEETLRSSCSFNYRPSSLLSLTTTYNAFFLDNDRSDTLTASMELSLLNTSKARLSVNASHTQGDETFNDFRVIGNWDISEYFSFTSNGNYSMAPERDTYSFYLSLALRL